MVSPQDGSLGHQQAIVPSAHSLGDASTVEKELLRIWARVLEQEEVGVDDDFFEEGGDSLAAIQLLVEVKKKLGVSLSVVELQAAPTAARLAAVIVRQSKVAVKSLLVPIQPQGARPPFFCVHGVGGVVFAVTALAHRCGPDQPFYGIRSPTLDGEDEQPFAGIEDMAASYVEQVRSLQPAGPYYLGGYSFGGSVALEMAQQMRALGQEVGLLAILDHTPPPLRYRRPSPNWDFATQFLANLPCWGLETLRSSTWKEILASVHIKARVLRRTAMGLLGRSAPPSGKTDVEDVFDLAGKPEPFVKLLEHHYGTLRAYVPSAYPGPVTLFRARVRPLLRHHGHDLGWNRLAAGGADVIVVPGDHWTMLKEPHVRVLAERLKECLRRSQNRAQPPT